MVDFILEILCPCQFANGYVHVTIWLRLPCQLWRLWQDYARVSKIAAEEAAVSVSSHAVYPYLANLADNYSIL